MDTDLKQTVFSSLRLKDQRSKLTTPVKCASLFTNVILTGQADKQGLTRKRLYDGLRLESIL
ncbi:hypothetical protein DSCW_03610 [Desulfosarcina widdelii]|uniref:Uncharacterized protein n=1 Tax=Desulfosarcina widdelii TaxID=947919 RepID=A0A5K7Z3A5_9BACT|nr:hypothetical protein DSCW_03610 [Desulfosarcina widdelii]